MVKQTIADLVISGLLKRGVVWEVKQLDTEIYIPSGDNSEKQIKIVLKAPNGMTVRIEKDDISQ